MYTCHNYRYMYMNYFLLHMKERDMRFTWLVREELNVKYLYVRMTGYKHAQSIMFTTGVCTSWSGYLEWNHVTGVIKTWKKGTKNEIKVRLTWLVREKLDAKYLFVCRMVDYNPWFNQSWWLQVSRHSDHLAFLRRTLGTRTCS